MLDTLRTLLPLIVRNPKLHGQWLNTFSYLEYIGFRKIVKSQHSDDLDAEILSHAVEEGRHALLLKKLAIKIGGPEFNSYASAFLLCEPQAVAYFQSLDQKCKAQLESTGSAKDVSRLTYLLVTWLVEVRALKVYGIYQEAMQSVGLGVPLRGLLAEEDRHLISVKEKIRESLPDFESHWQKLKDVEEELYQNFMMALVQEIRSQETPFDHVV